MTTSAETRSTAAAILDATLEVLGERGVKGATTRLIAERAGVNEVTLFRKFGDKNNLIKMALTDRVATATRESVRYTGDLEADLMSIAVRYHDTLKNFGRVARVVLTEIVLDAEFADSMKNGRQFFEALAAVLGRYQAEGVLQPEPIETLIPAFLGPIALPYLTLILADYPEWPDLDVRRHVNRFLHGRAVR